MKILIVDDDQTMVGLLKTLLQIEGFEVDALDLSVDSPAQKIMEMAPDAVVMDVHLKGLDGIDLLQKLRALPQASGIRILMTSGLDRKTDCLAAGADLFLQKPYMPQDLVQSLRDLCR